MYENRNKKLGMLVSRIIALWLVTGSALRFDEGDDYVEVPSRGLNNIIQLLRWL